MDYPITKGKPSFKLDNSVGATANSKKKNAKLSTSLFNAKALESSIATTANYAKKGKGANVNKSVFCSNDDNNSVFPDGVVG